MNPGGFKTAVLRILASIPRGRVMSYGQVAALAGSPRRGRQVGGILKGLDITEGQIPWWRVINSQGYLSIRGNWTATQDSQRELLLKEGVMVNERYEVDMGKYRVREA